jgi:hypothetical protein
MYDAFKANLVIAEKTLAARWSSIHCVPSGARANAGIAVGSASAHTSAKHAAGIRLFKEIPVC